MPYFTPTETFFRSSVAYGVTKVLKLKLLNRQEGENSAAIKPFFPSVACQCYAAVTMTNDGFETFTHCSYNVLH